MINGQLFTSRPWSRRCYQLCLGRRATNYAQRCPRWSTGDPLSDALHPCIDGFAPSAPLPCPVARSRRVCAPVGACARGACVRVRGARARAGARVRPRGGTPRAPCDTPLQTFSPNIQGCLKVQRVKTLGLPQDPLGAPSIPQPPKCLSDSLSSLGNR
jgi:hypothetical protein